MAFLQDSRPSREPFLIAPASVLWLIGVIFAAHVGRIVLPGDWPDLILNEFAFIPARYAGLPEFAGETVFQQAIPSLPSFAVGHVLTRSRRQTVQVLIIL